VDAHADHFSRTISDCQKISLAVLIEIDTFYIAKFGQGRSYILPSFGTVILKEMIVYQA
jgi:hypothetical protein